MHLADLPVDFGYYTVEAFLAAVLEFHFEVEVGSRHQDR